VRDRSEFSQITQWTGIGEYGLTRNNTWETLDGKQIWLGGAWKPIDQQTQQTERTVNMLHTIAVTTRAVVNTNNQTVTPERVVAGPDNDIIANDANAAMVIFGARHADEIKKADVSLLVVNYRQGV
jgi:hypothetical protein